MLSFFKFSRSFASGAIALGAALTALTLAPTPAHAKWVVVMHCAGTTRYDNTNNQAWEVLKNGGPAGPVEGVTSSWVTPVAPFNDHFTSGASIIESPTSGVLFNGTLADLVGISTDPTVMHSLIDSTGTITGELDWVPDPALKSDPVPSRVSITEEGSASSEVSTDGLSRPFDLLTQDAVVGMPGATLTVGEYAPGYPWKRAYASYTHIINNYNRSCKICLPSRFFRAYSSGKDNDGLWHFHTAGVAYNININGGGDSGNAKLLMMREGHGELRDQILLFDVGGAGSGGPNPLPASVNGRLWVGMQFEVYPHSRLMPRTKSVQLRLKEEADPQFAGNQHPDAENHIDPVLQLAPSLAGVGQGKMKWQKRIGPYGDTWDDTTEPFTTPNTDDAQSVFYRVLWAWDTDQGAVFGTKLWNRNGLHTVSLLRVGGSATNAILFKGNSDTQDDPNNPGHPLAPLGNVFTQFPDRQANVQNSFPSSN